MSGKILHKRSLTGGSVPTTSSLDNGELAINVNDGKVYLRRSGSGNDDIVPVVVANTVTTGSITLVGNQTITGSLVVTNNFTVLGSASIQYISESTLNIGTNLITVNTFNPSIRFGGLAVIDSGSSPLTSASFLYDSVQDEFIFVHRGDGVNITSSHFVLGPETYNDQGNEIYLTANRIPKGVGNEHLNDSNISDNGSLVTINSNTKITGSTVITGSLLVATSPGVPNIDSTNRYLYDSTPVISVNWNGKQLNDTSQVLSIDWGSRTLNGSDQNLSIDWTNRTLNDENGATVTDFTNRTITQHFIFSNKTHNKTNLEDFSSTFNYAGQVLQGVTLDTGAPVALYDLVYLASDGAWYQVINDVSSPTGTDRKLGIVVVDNNGTGDVLLEGDIVVSDSGGDGIGIRTQGTVQIDDTIYIGEYNPYPAGSIANDLPGTGGVLRILGHLYYQNQDTNTANFILRFNPSNDYYFYS